MKKLKNLGLYTPHVEVLVDDDFEIKKSKDRVELESRLKVYASICVSAPCKMRLVQILLEILEKSEW